MTTKNMEARRKAFEEAYKAKVDAYFDKAVFARNASNEEYTFGNVQAAWWGYNAALDSICVELPSPIQAPNEEDFGDDYEAYEYEEGHTVSMNRLLAECKQALTAAGVPYK